MWQRQKSTMSQMTTLAAVPCCLSRQANTPRLRVLNARKFRFSPVDRDLRVPWNGIIGWDEQSFHGGRYVRSHLNCSSVAAQTSHSKCTEFRFIIRGVNIRFDENRWIPLHVARTLMTINLCRHGLPKCSINIIQCFLNPAEVGRKQE
jgi:hypothetical protein